MDLSSHGGEMPIPMPISSKYVGHSTLQQTHQPNGPPPTTPSPPTTTTDHHHHNNHNPASYGMTAKKTVLVKYRECLKNHAAAIGGNATDGCGEFMPSGEEGSMEALKCSACNCHRNFHRKEVEGEPPSMDNPYPFPHHQYPKGGSRSKVVGQKGVLVSTHNSSADPFGYSPILPLPSPHHHHMVMPIGALHTSESDEMEGCGGFISRPPTTKKRFRTKFTPDQKEKMLNFAEKVGWRLQRQEESVVQQFCQEIGVKRRVLKVWMHNNKHNFTKKFSPDATSNISAILLNNNNNNNTSCNSNDGGGVPTSPNNPIPIQVQPSHVPMQTDRVSI